VDAGDSILHPVNVEAALGQLDLLPLQIAQLGRPQAVAIANQDHSRVPMAVAAGLPGGRATNLQRELGFDLIGLSAPMRIVTNAFKT
jgi:hypothetical protein